MSAPAGSRPGNPAARVSPGAGPGDVLRSVALPIEQQVNGVGGMLYMQSASAADCM